MKPLISALSLLFALAGQTTQLPDWQPSSGHTRVPIWPGAAPDAQPFTVPETTTADDSLIAGKRVITVNNVARPTMTVYSPTGNNTGAGSK